MGLGLAAARGDHPAQARRCWQRALAIARELLQEVVDGRPLSDPSACEARVAAFVVTHHNLADLRRDAGQLRAATAHLCIAHRTLTALACAEGASARLQLAALRQIRETHAALLGHLRNHGPDPQVEVLVEMTAAPEAWGGGRVH